MKFFFYGLALVGFITGGGLDDKAPVDGWYWVSIICILVILWKLLADEGKED